MSKVFTQSNFQSEVINSKIPVFVDFYADWCAPCKMMAPVIDEIAKAYEGKLSVGKIDVDTAAAISQKYNIMSIPAMLLFKNGKVVETFVGVTAKNVLIQKIDANL